MTEIVFAAVVAVSFGLLFNVRGANLPLTGLNGGVGYFFYTAAGASGLESYIGMLFASLAMSVFAEAAARLRKAPASLFLAPALIPIVPGGGMFRCVLSLLEGEHAAAVAVGINTMLESGAIAIGIIVISSLVKWKSCEMGS